MKNTTKENINKKSINTVKKNPNTNTHINEKKEEEKTTNNSFNFLSNLKNKQTNKQHSEKKNVKEKVINTNTIPMNRRIIASIKSFFKEMSSPLKQIFIWYVGITLMGALILFSPLAQTSTYIQPIKFIDTLFIAASAFSDTGLSTIDISIAFNSFGQSIIAILIIIGGVGWFGIKLFLLHFIIKKAVTHKSLFVLNNERGYSRLGSTFEVIKVAIIVQIIAITFLGLGLSLSFLFSDPTNADQFSQFIIDNSWVTDNGVIMTNTTIGSDNIAQYLLIDPTTNKINFISDIKKQEAINLVSPKGEVGLSFRNGFFIAISAMNNAGFDILQSSSITPYVLNYDIQLILLFLFILGGIGFPVIYDIKEHFTHKIHGQQFRLSLLTKVSIVSYIVISLFVWAMTLTLEVGILRNTSEISTSGVYSQGEQVWILTFLSFSTRNAGFSTIDLSGISNATMFIFMLSMFIGSSPASTTGGIRNTTMAIIILSLVSFTRGRERTTAFKKTIPQKQVNNAYSVFIFSLILIILVSTITTSTITNNQEFVFHDVLFETFSAFGTTGLSTGLTANLNIPSKLAIIFMMFIGQLGISTAIQQFTPKNAKWKTTSYPVEEVALG